MNIAEIYQHVVAKRPEAELKGLDSFFDEGSEWFRMFIGGSDYPVIPEVARALIESHWLDLLGDGACVGRLGLLWRIGAPIAQHEDMVIFRSTRLEALAAYLEGA